MPAAPRPTPPSREEIEARLSDARAALGTWGRLADNVRTLRDLWRDPLYHVRGTDKVQLVLCLVYCLSPIDLIPDFILGLGLIDDAFVLAWLFKVLGDVAADYRVWRAARERVTPSHIIDIETRPAAARAREVPRD